VFKQLKKVFTTEPVLVISDLDKEIRVETNALGSIYSQKKCIEESFAMVVEANIYIKQFPKYQQFSV